MAKLSTLHTETGLWQLFPRGPLETFLILASATCPLTIKRLQHFPPSNSRKGLQPTVRPRHLRHPMCPDGLPVRQLMYSAHGPLLSLSYFFSPILLQNKERVNSKEKKTNKTQNPPKLRLYLISFKPPTQNQSCDVEK